MVKPGFREENQEGRLLFRLGDGLGVRGVGRGGVNDGLRPVVLDHDRFPAFPPDPGNVRDLDDAEGLHRISLVGAVYKSDIFFRHSRGKARPGWRILDCRLLSSEPWVGHTLRRSGPGYRMGR